MKPHQPTIKPIPYVPGKGDGYWVNTDTMDVIRQKCGPRHAKHLVLYCLLNSVGTDCHSPTFQVSHGHLSKLSGIRLGVVVKCLTELAAVGVIRVETPGGLSCLIDGLVKVTLLGEVRL